MHTPFFPAWRSRLAPMKAHAQILRRSTLSQIEELFAPFVPSHLLAQCDEGRNSRQRQFSIRRTFWGFLFQVLTPATSCREVVRQLQALLGLGSEQVIHPSTSAYCQARQRLPRERFEKVLSATAEAADQRCANSGRLGGRPIKVIDCTSTQLPDTPANQRRYPQPRNQKPGCGFPVMKIAALFSLGSGALLATVHENLHWHDVRLFRRLWSWLRSGDILVGDRSFADYVSLAELPKKGVDLVCRLHQGRKIDFRRGKRLGPGDARFTWIKTPVRPRYLTRRQWKRVPDQIEVRVLRIKATLRGFRTRSIHLVTTLLDAHQFPAADLFALYHRRWRLELCFRDLKTTMGMEQLRCQTPAMVHKEFLAYLVAYNLIRCVIAESAFVHEVSQERISFKGALDSVRQFSNALAQARNRTSRRRLCQGLFLALAKDLLPDRPGRHEPRAVKRRPKPFPLLNRKRREFKETPHRNRYWKSNPRKTTA